jgi:hypothetical protein
LVAFVLGKVGLRTDLQSDWSPETKPSVNNQREMMQVDLAERLAAFKVEHPYREVTVGDTAWQYRTGGASTAPAVLFLPGGALVPVVHCVRRTRSALSAVSRHRTRLPSGPPQWLDSSRA